MLANFSGEECREGGIGGVLDKERTLGNWLGGVEKRCVGDALKVGGALRAGSACEGLHLGSADGEKVGREAGQIERVGRKWNYRCSGEAGPAKCNGVSGGGSRRGSTSCREDRDVDGEGLPGPHGGCVVCISEIREVAAELG